MPEEEPVDEIVVEDPKKKPPKDDAPIPKGPDVK